MPKIGISVYPLVSEWSFNLDQKGARGIRKYITQYAGGSSTEVVQLPSIGDPWSIDFIECRCRKIKVNYPQDSDACVSQMFTCIYETELHDTQANKNDGSGELTAKQLTTSIEGGGEFVSVQQNPNDKGGYFGWNWEKDGVQVNQPILKHVGLTTYKLTVMVKDLNAFLLEHWRCIGKVNADEFLGCRYTTLLYTGFNASPWRSETDAAKWKCELTFVHRLIYGGDEEVNGWNYIVRERLANANTDFWQRPKQYNGRFLYESYEFAGLITVGAETSDNITAAKVPKK